MNETATARRATWRRSCRSCRRRFPRAPINVGESWMREMPLPGGSQLGAQFSGKLHVTFRFDSLTHGGDWAFVSMRGEMHPAAGHGVGVERRCSRRESSSGTMLVDQKRGWLTESWFTIVVSSVITPPLTTGIVSMHMQMRINAAHAHGGAALDLAVEPFTPHAPGSPLRSAPRLPAVSAAHSRRDQSAGGGRRRDLSRGDRPDHRARAGRRRRRRRRVSHRAADESGDPARVHAVLAARRRRCRTRMIVLVAGNHDYAAIVRDGRHSAAASRSSGCTSSIASRSGSQFPDRDLSILAVPDVPGLARPALDARSGRASSTCSCCTVEIRGDAVRERDRPADRAAIEISARTICARRGGTTSRSGTITCIAEVAPNAFYSGSIDYTSVNTWGELYEESKSPAFDGKGFIERDLATGEHTFHALPPSRPLIDLPPINARGLTAAEIDERIRAAVEAVTRRHRRQDRPAGRPRPAAAHRARARSQGDSRLQAARAELPSRPSPPGRRCACRRPARRDVVRRSKDIVREKLLARPLDADVDRDVLVARAIAYLDEAQVVAHAPSAAARRV